MTLALGDRLLLKLCRGPASARDLSRVLGSDVGAVHRLLRGLERLGIVEAVPRARDSLEWRLAQGVEVAYKPAEVVVTSLRPLPKEFQESPGACRGLTFAGKRCKLPGVRQGLCFLHAPPGDVGEPMLN
jgi:DNA-binding IclR family transcriptional regulator